MPVYAWKMKVAYKIKGSKSGHLNSLQTLTLFEGIFHISTGWSVAHSPIDIRSVFFSLRSDHALLLLLLLLPAAAPRTAAAAAAVNGFIISTAAATAGAITSEVLTNFVMTGSRTSSESHTKVVGC